MKLRTALPVAAGALLIAGIASAQETKTYSATDLPNRIPASGTSGAMDPSTITIPAEDCGGRRGKVHDINVGITYQHTFNGDLTVSLEGPNEKSILLWDSVGGSSNDMNVVMDDEAGSPMSGQVLDGSARQPTEPLCTFDGLEPGGDWTLMIVDNFGGDSGQLTDWWVEVTCDSKKADSCAGDDKVRRGGGSYANNGGGNGDQQAPPGQHGDHPHAD